MSVATEAALPALASSPRAADLLLVRLLPAPKVAPTLGKVRPGLDPFFRQPPSAEQWQELVEHLRGVGLIELKSLRLTEAGRTRALAFLGVGELPPRTTWDTIQGRFLVPKALGLAPAVTAGDRRRQSADKIAALLLRQQYHLPVGADPSLNDALVALVCQELGFPEEASFEGLLERVLSRKLSSGECLPKKKLLTQVPRVLLKAKPGARGLREVALQGWLDGTPAVEPPPPPPDFDLPTFANTVKAAARDCPTGRFGDNKVFVSHVWRRLRDEPGFPRLDLPAFKQKLLEANAADLLTLSRADLVQLMDETDVRESETRYLNAEFHFILVEREQP